MSFSYFINYDICDPNDIQLLFYFYNDELLEQIVFQSNKFEGFEMLSNRKWNINSFCFHVNDHAYSLLIEAESSCAISSNNNAFIAVDDIFIREVNNPQRFSSCLDIQIVRNNAKDADTTISSDYETSMFAETFQSSDITENVFYFFLLIIKIRILQNKRLCSKYLRKIFKRFTKTLKVY